ncbi:Undecaprenyl-diphosphatase, partial [hydrothermal vent metagenome]
KKSKMISTRTPTDIKMIDSVTLGIVQGFAALPGLSRSGLTVASLLLRKFDEEQAIRLSFLMSIPIVLAGNILLNIKDFNPTLENLFGFFFSFVFGLATIHILLKVAKKVNFAYFVLLFGLLMIGSLFF